MMAWLIRIGMGPALACGLALAGCGKSSKPDVVIDEAALNAMASSGPTVKEVLARGNDSVPVRPTPVEFDASGRWATAPALCAGKAWRFSAAEVVTPAGARCAITKRDIASDSAKRLTMDCTMGGLKTIERWSLVRHDDGGMTVARTEGGNGVQRSTTLKRCG